MLYRLAPWFAFIGNQRRLVSAETTHEEWSTRKAVIFWLFAAVVFWSPLLWAMFA
jgi:hypothetical protein